MAQSVLTGSRRARFFIGRFVLTMVGCADNGGFWLGARDILFFIFGRAALYYHYIFFRDYFTDRTRCMRRGGWRVFWRLDDAAVNFVMHDVTELFFLSGWRMRC
jgi:hypothetical protein